MFVKKVTDETILYYQMIMKRSDFYYYFQEDMVNKIYGYSSFVFFDEGKHIPDVGFKINELYYGLINQYVDGYHEFEYDLIFKYKDDHLTFSLTLEDLEKVENGEVPVLNINTKATGWET